MFLLPANLKTFIFAMIAALGFALQDAVVKMLTVNGSLWQLMLLRSLLVVSLIIACAYFWNKTFLISPSRKLWPLIRAVFMSLAYTLFYASLPFVSVSEASVCFFVAPAFVCLFAVILLGEKIGFWRISSVFIGFIGVLIVIQPGFDGFKPVLFLPLAAGAAYALAVVITRGFCGGEPSFALIIVHNLFYAFLGAFFLTFLTFLPLDPQLASVNPFLLSGWMQSTKALLFLIGLTALTHILAMTSSIVAYQNSEASLVAPLEYTYLIFAAFLDFLIWDFIPSETQVLGAVTITTSGAIIAWREWSRSK